jgi:hypothetical protein
MQKSKNDRAYQSGVDLANGMLPHISKTGYGSVENAIIAKQTLVNNFETEFGFSREESDDYNYCLNLGILDTLNTAKDENR